MSNFNFEFDPANPRRHRALLTLRYSKHYGIAPGVLVSALKYLCASGVSYEKALQALLKGGYTPAEANTLVVPCYPTLPLVAPPP